LSLETWLNDLLTLPFDKTTAYSNQIPDYQPISV